MHCSHNLRVRVAGQGNRSLPSATLPRAQLACLRPINRTFTWRPRPRQSPALWVTADSERVRESRSKGYELEREGERERITKAEPTNMEALASIISHLRLHI